MIDERWVQKIRADGTYRDAGVRDRILRQDIGFRVGVKAEYALVTGCDQPDLMPESMLALKGVLDRLEVDYTLLPREHCCGWRPLGQPAVVAKNDEDIAKAKDVARDFILANEGQAEALGARSLVLVCAACEPVYTYHSPDIGLEVISFSELLDRHFSVGRLDSAIDYYAGCYRFRRRVTSEPVDVEPALRVLDKIAGLRVHSLDNKLCCYVGPHLEEIVGSLATDTLVTICNGCYYQLRDRLKEVPGIRLKMLPEFVLEALQDQ